MKASRLTCALLMISLAEAVAQQPAAPAIPAIPPGFKIVSPSVTRTNQNGAAGAKQTTIFGDPIVGYFATNRHDAGRGETNGPWERYQAEEFQRIKADAEKGDATNQYNLGQTYAEEKNFVEAVKWWRKAAEQNVAEAQHNLGACYFDGRGVVKDEVEAVKWYRKAAEQNLAEAQLKLSICYAAGQGVERDTVEAAKWFSKVDSVEAVKFFRSFAEQNIAIGQCFLGVFYENGMGVAKDAVEAVKWYRKAAEQNDATAQCNLGICFAEGNGVAKDYGEAVKWYREAAKQNYATAQYGLGVCYAKGEGVAKDYEEAVKWYRKAAEQNNPMAQANLGVCYGNGQGVAKDYVEGGSWLRKAAQQNYAMAQYNLGISYSNGLGVAKDEVEAVKWFRKAAEQNYAMAQYCLGVSYGNGQGVAKDYVEAVGWYRKAAEQNCADAQVNLGWCYDNGQGVAKDYVEAYKWLNLALAQGSDLAKINLSNLEQKMMPAQIADAQRLSREFKPRMAPQPGAVVSSEGIVDTRPAGSGSGFFITEDGFLVTNEHVVKDATQVRLVTSAGLISAKVVSVDGANDLALLKAEGKFAALPVASSRAVKMGSTVTTVGFPNIGLQGFAPKLAKGEIAALSGAQDDPRYFQISVPVQPGNSGGALVDERGNVVGVVSAKLDAAAALTASGALPENVNYAVKSSFLLSFLESVPEVSARLKEPNTKERKFEDVVKSAEQAAVLVLVY